MVPRPRFSRSEGGSDTLEVESIEIVSRRPEDDPAIRALLEGAEVSTADLSPGLLERFLVARADGVVVGAVGLEPSGRAGLLRSLVVHPAARERGLGTRLVEELETRARAAGVDDVYLLTTTAGEFFRDRGFRRTCQVSQPHNTYEPRVDSYP